MAGWVALLRGINLGSRNRVAMAELRRVLEEAGYDAVATYIQSGNVLFTSRASERRALARRLEGVVEETFGVQSVVVLRTFAEIRKVARSHPFGRDTSNSHVAFLDQKPGRGRVRELAQLDFGSDEYEVAGSDVFLRYPNGVQGSTLSAALLERRLGVAATVRNWKTVARLAEMTESR